MATSKSPGIILKFLCRTLVVLAAFTQNQHAQKVRPADHQDSVAATVNEKQILISEVERSLNQQTGKSDQLNQWERKAAQAQILESLIDRELLFQRAEKEGVLPTEEQVSAAIEEQERRSQLTEEEYVKELNKQNLSPSELRAETRKDLAIRLLQEKYADQIQISDEEVEDYYKRNARRFVRSRGVSLSMIVVDPANNRADGVTHDAKGEIEARRKIELLFRQLKAGADFATLARTKSEDAGSLVHGGDLGFASPDDLRQNGFPNDLINQFFGKMRVSDFTPPRHFRTSGYLKSRWYIFRLDDRVLRTEQLTLDTPGTRHEITKILLNLRKELVNAALLTTARNEAKIVNYLAAKQIKNP